MMLMIVESPIKAAKIEADLGIGWKVVASRGHIRDLPSTSACRGGVASLKSIGIASEDYSLTYEFIPSAVVDGYTRPGGKERVGAIRTACSRASMIYLATDPDREGEAIAWHLKDALHLDEDRCCRVAFNEVTEQAIRNSLTKPHRVDLNLVHAQEARRAIDRMVGYLVSPLISNRLGITVSAGRVQSAATRLVVDREREITAFCRVDHFGAEIAFDAGSWRAEWLTKPFLSKGMPLMLDKALADRAAGCTTFTVVASTNEIESEAPPKPFSTALMLRAANVALTFEPEATAVIAQRLFEQGAISYVRTDSVNFGAEAIEQIRDFARKIGLPVAERAHRFAASCSAQEAHEAIRPVHIDVEDAGLTDEERALYRLIRERTIASQLGAAQYRVSTLILEAADADQTFTFRARGSTLVKKGWRSLTQADVTVENLTDETNCSCGTVPSLSVGTTKSAGTGQILHKRTVAPRRYSKASLIEKLEVEGIGRPATYPSIMKTITKRGYLKTKERFLHPTELGERVVDVLVNAEFSFIDIEYTRRLEERLDAIAAGKMSYREVVGNVYNQLRGELERFSCAPDSGSQFTGAACGEGLHRRQHPAGAGDQHCSNLSYDRYIDNQQHSPNSHPCPKCRALLRRYRRKDGSGFLWACPTKDCRTFLDDDDGHPSAGKTAPCPRCGRAMYRRKSRSDPGFWWGCSGYREGCDYKADDVDGEPASCGSRKQGQLRGLIATRRRFPRR